MSLYKAWLREEVEDYLQKNNYDLSPHLVEKLTQTLYLHEGLAEKITDYIEDILEEELKTQPQQ